MVQDAGAYLIREREFIQSLNGPAYLLQIPRYLEALERHPVISRVLADLVVDFELAAAEHADLDDAITPDLIALRQELATALPPEEDDSTMEPPTVTGFNDPYAYFSSFANFDAIAAGSEYRARGSGAQETTDHTRSGQLIQILQQKLQNKRHEVVPPETPGGPARYVERTLPEELQAIDSELGTIASAHAHRHRAFTNAMRTSPGLAYGQLERFLTQMNPKPRRLDDDAAVREYLHELLRTADTQALLDRALYSTPSTGLREDDTRALESLIDDGLRPLIERLHIGLLREIDLRRSYVSTLRRFKARCEWHDRDRLLTLASGRKPEGVLAAELARFLFDQGFSPLTEPLVSDLRPDIFDPSLAPNVWVEAKQYASGNPRSRIIKWSAQTYNTVRRHLGTEYDVREVFLVIFRRGGRDVALPETFTLGEFQIYPLLIDIAPASVSGSQQGEPPVVVSVDDLRAVK